MRLFLIIVFCFYIINTTSGCCNYSFYNGDAWQYNYLTVDSSFYPYPIQNFTSGESFISYNLICKEGMSYRLRVIGLFYNWHNEGQKFGIYEHKFVIKSGKMITSEFSVADFSDKWFDCTFDNSQGNNQIMYCAWDNTINNYQVIIQNC